MNEKRRNGDNGVKRYLNPTWLAVMLLIAGFLITFIANIKTIPAIAKRSTRNSTAITKLEANYIWILKGIDDLKDLIKERR